METKTIINIGHDKYINDIEAKRIYKNGDVYQYFCILDIADDGTVIYKHTTGVNEFNMNDSIFKDEDFKVLLQELQKIPEGTKEATKKETERKTTKTSKKTKK